MIGERLYDLRKDAGLTQSELAKILNTNNHSISAYERDKNEPSDITKIQIAKFFRVSVDYLLGLTDDPGPYLANKRAILIPSWLPESARADLEDYLKYLITIKYSSMKHL